MGLIGTRRALLGGGRPSSGLLAWDGSDLLADTWDGGLNSEALTFTPAMAKRAVTVPAGGSLVAPLVQGKLDGTAGDALSYGRGTQVVANWYDTMDPYQFTISFWYRPEYAGNDGLNHGVWYSDVDFYMFKALGNTLRLQVSDVNYDSGATSWAAGAWVHVVVSLSLSNTIDGTNYVRFSINNAHSYAGAAAPTLDLPAATVYLGSYGPTLQSNAAISDFHIFRRILTDGDNVIPAPEGANADEIAALYAAGAGAPASSVIVDYGESCVFGFPTNGTAETLAAASAVDALYAPLRADNKLADWHCQTAYAASAWATLGTPATGPTDDTTNMIFGANCYTFDPDADEEGITQAFVAVAGQDYYISAWVEDAGDFAAEVEVYDATGSASILTLATSGAGGAQNLTGCFEVPAGCISVAVRVKSTNAGQGAVIVHQVLVYSNLWDDGGMETGTAPTDVGTPTTSAQSGDQEHSGAASWKVVADATDEGIKRAITTTSGSFYMAAGYVYAATAGTVDLTIGGKTVTSAGNDAWKRLTLTFRATAASTDVSWLSNAAQTFYVDDVVVHELDPITLTCTAANEAASRESMALTPWGTADTLRVDGRDTLSIPTANNLIAAEGVIALWVKFRHATAWADECLWFTSITSPNAFALYRIATTNVLSVFYGNLSDTSTATIANTNWHHIAFTWKGGTCYLYIDGVAAAGFAITGATVPTLAATLYLGSNGTPALDADAAILGVITGNRAISGGEVLRLYNRTVVWTLGDI